MLDVVTLGKAMLMLVDEEPVPLEKVQHYTKRSAGAETNVAIGLARLGLKVGWQSRLGSDSMARYLLAVIGGVFPALSPSTLAAKLSVERTTMAILPWLVPLLASLVILTYVPAISLWLPRTMGF